VYKNTRECETEHGPVEDIKIALKAARETNGCTKRQYDLPSANEIAVQGMDIVRDGHFATITE